MDWCGIWQSDDCSPDRTADVNAENPVWHSTQMPVAHKFP